jgi:L-alanine-DL-glutamate epimerase-like enolase superfamily enzyme
MIQTDRPIELRAHLMRLPLTVPYRLVFGDLKHFDVILVGVRDADGACGWGEATILPGYTDETVEQGWALAREAASTIRTTAGARAFGTVAKTQTPFTATAFLTAVDWLDRRPALRRAGRVELLGTINGKVDDLAALEAEIESLLAHGYRTLKIKIGWNVAADLRQVAAVRSIVAGRAKLRIDANQGYSIDEAIEFLTLLDPTDVELVEQPCAAGDWDAAVAAKRASGAPMMLDESIYGLEDIDRAALLGCADYIKLKLMKLGDLDTLEAGLRMIADRGMKPVLGNGVASDLGCWMEASCALGGVRSAGEMNGFLKTPARILRPALVVEGADIVVTGAAPEIDETVLQSHTIAATGSWGSGAASRSPGAQWPVEAAS